MVGCREIRQRIAAKNRRFVRVEMQAQNDKLTRLAERKKLPIDWLQNEGSHAIAFLTDLRNSHLSKSGPRRSLLLIRESRIPRHSFGARILLEHRLERTLPTLAKCRNLQRALQLLAGMSWQIQQGVNIGHTDSLWTISNFYNVIACTNFSLPQHAKVESWSVMCYEQRWHTRLVHADADAVARHSWLRHFKFSATNSVSIADAHIVISKPLDGEVFAELTESKITAAQKTLPVMVRVHLVNKNGTLLPSVTGEIGFRIPTDIELSHPSPPLKPRFST